MSLASASAETMDDPPAMRQHDPNLETFARHETVGLPPASVPERLVTSALYDLHIEARDPSREASGDLVLESTLGEGGMGRVYLASQRSLHRQVALKTARSESGTEPLMLEGVITGMLEHPNIPPVHALGLDAQGKPALVMKRIEGVAWSDVLDDEHHPLRTSHPFFARDALLGHIEILVQICNALEFAHARGVIHRDIKPSNVMLGAYGEVYLLDWGVAYAKRLQHAGSIVEVVGTPAYMAPEMTTRALPDARTDVYLLGATLLEVLTGHPPHRGPSAMEAFSQARIGAPPVIKGDVPRELAALCTASLSREPYERPASAAEFQRALRTYVTHRAAATLSSATRARLEELRVVLSLPDVDPAVIAQLSTECRFGFRQALQDWPDHPDAIAGLTDTLRLLAEHSLAAGNVASVTALLAEMPGEDASLRARLDALVAAQRERAERARESAQARDATVAQRERAFILVGFVILMSILGWYGRRSMPSAQDTHIMQVRLVKIALAFNIALFTAVGLARRRLRESQFNRGWVFSSMLIVVAILIHRLLTLPHLVPLASIVSDDMLIMSVVLSMGAVLKHSRWVAPALVALLGAVGDSFLPSYAPILTNMTVLSVLALLYLISRAEAHESHEEKRGESSL